MSLVKSPHPLLLDCGFAFWVASVQQSQIVVQRSNGSMLAWARNRRNALVCLLPTCEHCNHVRVPDVSMGT